MTCLEVELLARVDRQRLVPVGFPERCHRRADFGGRDCRETRAEHALPSVATAATAAAAHAVKRAIHDLKADILAFAVAIEPQHEGVGAGRLTPEVVHHVRLGVGLLPHGLCVKEVKRVGLVPAVERRREVNVEPARGVASKGRGCS
eukprot:19811-Chlamydomonas_euryale.AAC.2